MGGHFEFDLTVNKTVMFNAAFDSASGRRSTAAQCSVVQAEVQAGGLSVA